MPSSKKMEKTRKHRAISPDSAALRRSLHCSFLFCSLLQNGHHWGPYPPVMKHLPCLITKQQHRVSHTTLAVPRSWTNRWKTHGHSSNLFNIHSAILLATIPIRRSNALLAHEMHWKAFKLSCEKPWIPQEHVGALPTVAEAAVAPWYPWWSLPWARNGASKHMTKHGESVTLKQYSGIQMNSNSTTQKNDSLLNGESDGWTVELTKAGFPEDLMSKNFDKNHVGKAAWCINRLIVGRAWSGWIFYLMYTYYAHIYIYIYIYILII